ncbi:PRC-barrel domain-containing protein [Streptomyces sp. NPDC059072]|uniref:PRC-barrel domain-containing protein n=1 Tax=Streptomyces sp. NPDC059072 TaxID=3346715 RepID=UPI0036A8D608
MVSELWTYSPTVNRDTTDLVGFEVEVVDGRIGTVDEETAEVGAAHLVVDTGVWIFGKHVLVPAGTIDRIDVREHKVYVALTKEQVKDSPEFDPAKHRGDAAYRDELGNYYRGQNMGI